MAYWRFAPLHRRNEHPRKAQNHPPNIAGRSEVVVDDSHHSTGKIVNTLKNWKKFNIVAIKMTKFQALTCVTKADFVADTALQLNESSAPKPTIYTIETKK